MALRIRLQRRGRKKRAFYAIVVAESTSPRDGRFVEKIGTYDPLTNPATIDVNFERALHWLEVGALPTDTTRNLLAKKGVMMMKHLNRGVKKGAFDQTEAQRRFEEWKKQKDSKIQKVALTEKEKQQKKLQELINIEKEARKKKEAIIKERLAKAIEQPQEETQQEETPENKEE